MVLYKRRPVKLEPAPKSIDDNTEIWVIEQTGEIFTDYEKFLNRRDFYDQRKFTCESTGHSGYTFFEAKESEVRSTPVLAKGSLVVTSPQTEASREINSILPDALRSRILHFVQFQTTTRMDDLVNDAYDHFREQFMVNDRVSVEGEPKRKLGRIIEMNDTNRLHSIFSGQSMDDPARTFTYTVQLDDTDERVTKYKPSELQRDRAYFSKLIVKQFLRTTTTRERFFGSPWMVKEHLAKRYNIPMKMSDKRARDAIAQKKAAANGALADGGSPPVQQQYSHHGANGHGPHVNGDRPHIAGPGPGQATFVHYAQNGAQQYPQEMLQPHHPSHYLQPSHGQILPPPFAIHQPPPHLAHNVGPVQYVPPGMIPPHLANIPAQLALQIAMNPPQFQTSFVHGQQAARSNNAQPANTPVLSKAFEPVRYPMEDLEIRQPRTSPARPLLKFFSDDVPEGNETIKDASTTGIAMRSIGPLLTAWETLNVHDVIYTLDSFTFDDFVDAMKFTSKEIECELFIEVHCAILKQIVGSQGNAPKILTSLPKIAEAEASDEEESEVESEPTPEPEPPKRATRSSLRKSEAQQIVKARTPTPEPPKELHNAKIFVEGFDWIEACSIRNFREGGWQAIVVGVLYRLSFDPIQKAGCDEILAELVPAGQEPTIDDIAINYAKLDVNLRVSALDLILRLTVATEAFRDQLTNASSEMTKLRKEKIDHQRKRKELVEELCKLDLERKILLPDNTPASPTAIKELEDIDASMASITSEPKDQPEEEVDEKPGNKARLRHTNKNKRKAAAEEARKEKAKRAKADAEKNKKQKEWEKLLNMIEDKRDEIKECEANINELEDDLRETLVHRSKVLGKDRFLNKYYWFEHNGMPFGGVPNSSTAEYGYANGRIWVQGPDEYEFQPNMEEPAISEDRERFGFTIPQRKKREEGETHLNKSTEWAYYDEPAEIDQLLAWLDERGVREKSLRKELQAFKERISEYMVIMKKHLIKEEKTEEEEVEEEEEATTTRVSTRNKIYVDKNMTEERCLLWSNSIMREEFGFTHSEEYKPPRKARAKAAQPAKGKGKR